MRARLALPPPRVAASPETDHQPPLGSYSPAQTVFHGESVELFAPPGAEILAPAGGRISVAEGLTILIDHGDGSRTWFDGLKLAEGIAVGGEVSAGQVLGVIPEQGGRLTGARIRWGAFDPKGRSTDPRRRVVTRTDALLLFAAATLLMGAMAMIPSKPRKYVLED